MRYRSGFVKMAMMIAGVSGGLGAQPAPPAPPAPAAPAAPAVAPAPPRGRSSSRDYYRRGQSALDRRDYVGAIDAFQNVIEVKGDRADGALYWRAYAENKLGKRSEALATLAELQRTYASSRWLEDAKALEVEVRQASGTPQSPDAATDDDTKILVLNSMMNNDPDRTLPILEKLLKSNNSPKVKERALFVLAQGSSARSRQVIADIAKGRGNPDLQMKAVEYLGVFRGIENTQLLTDVYKSNSDFQIRRAVLHSFMVSGSRDAVLSVAKTETNPELRVEAIRQLGVMGANSDLLQLYSPDAPIEIRKAVLEGLFIGGNGDKILEIARTDKDPAMRREAIHRLGAMGRGKNSDGLPALYAKEADPHVKRTILDALAMQDNAAGLIEITRKETDRSLREAAVQKLSIMHSKEATDFLLELLNK
ncbi:MAG: HEAT repeat domain-containing protein [Acidobacteriaceae bacterium]|nr:HEAT repeat domain-containing protein [Acidobacteriaceae bacterium]